MARRPPQDDPIVSGSNRARDTASRDSHGPGEGITSETLQKATSAGMNEARDRLFGAYTYARTENWVNKRLTKKGEIYCDGTLVATIANKTISIKNSVYSPIRLRMPNESAQDAIERLSKEIPSILHDAGHTKAAELAAKDIGIFLLPYNKKRVHSKERREAIIEASHTQAQEEAGLEPMLYYVNQWEKPESIPARMADFLQGLHDTFVPKFFRAIKGNEEALKNIPVIGTWLAENLKPLDPKPPEARREYPTQEEQLFYSDKTSRQNNGEKLEEHRRTLYRDEIQRGVENYVFNRTEGKGYGFGEQVVRVSTGFAMMGSATGLSRWFFNKLGAIGQSVGRFLSGDEGTRQEEQQKLKEKGGIPGVLKDEFINAVGGSARHFLRDHMADWSVGFFYVYAKEEYMRKVGPLDTPEAYAWVMRRAFTVYNLWTEMVHHEGYDFAEDLILGDRKEKKGRFSTYRERHKPANYDELNVLQKGWNYVMDVVGFGFERGMQVFTYMQGATTFFGANRFHGIEKAEELSTLRELGFKFDKESGEIVHDNKGVMAKYQHAKQVMRKAQIQYREAQQKGEQWPVLESFINDETRRAWNEDGRPITDEETIKKQGKTDLQLVREYATAYAPTATFGEVEQKAFDRFSQLISKTLEGGNTEFARAMTQGFLTFGTDDASHKNDTNRAHRTAMQTASAFTGYMPYMSAKKAMAVLAEDSSTLGMVTGTGTSITDSLKFGRREPPPDKPDEKPKSFLRSVIEVPLLPFRLVGHVFGIGTRKEEETHDSPMHSHRSRMQADTGDTRIINNADRTTQHIRREIDEIVTNRFQRLAEAEKQVLAHSSPEELLTRLSQIETRVNNLTQQMTALRNTAQYEDARTEIYTELNDLREENRFIQELCEVNGVMPAPTTRTPQ